MTTLFNKGDAIRGDRIRINARRVSKSRVINQSGRHKAVELTVWDNAHCIIEKPLKVRPKEYNH